MGGSTNIGGGMFAQPQPLTGAEYNRRLQAGETSQSIRDSQKGGGFFGGRQGLSDNQFNDIVTQAAMQSPTGRPLTGSAQFYQPVYQPQYQDFNMGNPMSVSQYGQQPSFGGGFGGGIGGEFRSQMPTPFQQPMQQQFNPYTNNFGGGFGGGFGGFGGFGGGFMPQQQFQQPMPQMQMPFQPSMPHQDYSMDMQTPFQQPMPQAQSPFRSSGPSQAIVGRSSQMRGTPNVMRRAAGGITSLMDET